MSGDPSRAATMTSGSCLRMMPSAYAPLAIGAIPAESYPRYSSLERPSRMTGEALPLPTYPTMPHMKPVLYQNRFVGASRVARGEGDLAGGQGFESASG